MLKLCSAEKPSWYNVHLVLFEDGEFGYDAIDLCMVRISTFGEKTFGNS